MADKRKRSLIRRLEALLRRAGARAMRMVGRLPVPEETAQPIDFSAPSIPYYVNLAERFSLARIILYLLLFVFVVTAIISNRELITYGNLYYLVKDINAASLTARAQADALEYPASQTTPAFAAYRGGLVVSGSSEVTVLSGSGKQTLSVPVSYGTPAVAASDKYFLTYGLGERSFALFNAFSKVYSEETRFPVYGAAVADDGSFAILTRSPDYTSEVIFYDRNRQQRAAYHLNGYATCVSLNPSGETAAILSVESRDGQWETKISLIRISDHMSSDSMTSVTVSGDFGGVCDFVAEDRIAAVLAGQLYILRPDGNIQNQVSFGRETPVLCALTAGRVAVLTEDASELQRRVLYVFDKNGKEVYNRILTWEAAPTEMVFCGHELYIRTSGTVYRLSADGDTLTYAPLDRDTVCLLSGDKDVLVCGVAYATRLRSSELAAP